MNRARIGQLLLQIAEDRELDNRKMLEFERILGEGQGDRLVAMAADELTEYRLAWRPIRNILGRVKKEKPTAADLEEYRENLTVLGRAILSGVTEFKSLSDLKKRLSSTGAST